MITIRLTELTTTERILISSLSRLSKHKRPNYILNPLMEFTHVPKCTEYLCGIGDLLYPLNIHLSVHNQTHLVTHFPPLANFSLKIVTSV